MYTVVHSLVVTKSRHFTGWKKGMRWLISITDSAQKLHGQHR
ncbi:alpha/beta hydrolase fold domain protein [Yersinia enterocolitica]|nr:alpha/beta hydrolase fold domain protein [Yersinia enterocolitica]